MEQDRKPGDKSLHPWTTYLSKRRQKIYNGEKNLFNKCCWENWSTMGKINMEIRLITSFSAKHGKTLYNKQKQDGGLTVV